MRSFLLRNEGTVRLFILAIIYLAFFTPVVVGSHFLFPFVFPKAIYLEALMELGFLFCLFLLVVDRRYLPRLNPILIALGAYLLWMEVTVVLGVDPSLSFWSKAERMDGLFQYLHFAIFTFLLLVVVRSEREWVRLFRFVIATGWIVGITSLVSKYFPNALNYGDQTRLGGTFGNPAFLATYFLVLWFFTLIFLFQAKHFLERIFFGASSLFFLWLLLLSGTRGAFVGLLVGAAACLFALALADWKRWGTVVSVTLLLLLFLGIDLFIAQNLVWQLAPKIADRLFSIWQFPQARLIVWKMGIQAFLARPILGWGPENFLWAFNLHFDPSVHTYELSLFDRAHNKIIDLLVMNGIPGLMLYIVLFGAMFWELLKILKHRLASPIWAAGFFGLMVGYFVQNLVLFEMPTSGLLLFFLLGFLGWFVNQSRRAPPQTENQSTTKERSSGILPLWSAVFAVPAVALVFFYGIVQPYYAAQAVVEASAWLSQDQQLETAIEQGLAYYHQARDTSTFLDREVDVLAARKLRGLAGLQPSIAASSTAYQDFAKLLISNLQDDLRRHPLDYDAEMEAGNIAYMLEPVSPNFVAQAVASWEKGEAMAPKREDAYQDLAFFYMDHGQYDKANEELNKLLALNDKVGLFWWYRAVYYARIGDDKDLDTALQRAETMVVSYDWSSNPSDLNFLASTFAKEGKIAQAIRYNEIMLQIPNLPSQFEIQARANLVPLYLKEGQRDKAAAMAAFLRAHAPEGEKSNIETYLKALGF